MKPTHQKPQGKTVVDPISATAMHRSLHSLVFPRSRWLVVLLLPLLFALLVWWTLPLILYGWEMCFSFWLNKLQLPARLVLQSRPFLWGELALPLIHISASAPDTITWGLTADITLLAFLISFKIPDTSLPLRYFLRVAAFIQLTALIYFLIAPEDFPYTLTDYLSSSLTGGIWFLLLVPLVHAPLYYILEFSLVQKYALTLMTLGFIGIALPLQLLLHAYLVFQGTMLLLPLLYLLFGILPLTMGCVGLYGWAMSWSHSTRNSHHI